MAAETGVRHPASGVRTDPLSLTPDAQRLKASRGFTLLEALVALVIFGVLTLSLSLALTTALHAQVYAQQRQQEEGTVRAIFGSLSRDVQAAYVSLSNPAAIFIAGGGQSQSTIPPAAKAPPAAKSTVAIVLSTAASCRAGAPSG